MPTALNGSQNQSKTPIKYDAVTLERVLTDFENWRANKTHSGQAIPNHLWLKIFKLSETINLNRVKSIFGVNSKQYNSKHEELVRASLPPVKAVSTKQSIKRDAVFCEASVNGSAVPPLTAQQNSTAQAVAHLKSNDNSPENYLDLSTIIVECIHPNGHRLKIHTTTKKLQEVMHAFFATGGSPV